MKEIWNVQEKGWVFFPSGYADSQQHITIDWKSSPFAIILQPSNQAYKYEFMINIGSCNNDSNSPVSGKYLESNPLIILQDLAPWTTIQSTLFRQCSALPPVAQSLYCSPLFCLTAGQWLCFGQCNFNLETVHATILNGKIRNAKDGSNAMCQVSTNDHK